ncbi:MAG: hypothetical protein HPY53_08720 [Brevinematales bacterium]|nr:hypothetical protein [Brevinematales bacterium]
MKHLQIGIVSALFGVLLISGCSNPKDEWKGLMNEYESLANQYSAIADKSSLDDKGAQEQLKGIFSNMQVISEKFRETKIKLSPEDLQVFEERMDAANAVLLQAKANQVKKAMESIMGGSLGTLMNGVLIDTLTNQTNK